jgi:NSS family neurotransmitter:Na+ symporter
MRFLFEPDWSKLSSDSLVTAIGHGFFTLSLGMGAIMTYSASLPKDANITKSAISVTVFDTLIALIAGIVIFSLLFQYGEEPSKGPGLVFISMPVVFHTIGESGVYLSLLFLSALAFAGLTSAVSLVEPAVLYVVNRWKIARFTATIAMGGVYFIVGIGAILSYSGEYGELFSFFGTPLFDILEKATDTVLLPLSGIFIALIIGYKLKRTKLNPLKKEMGDTLFRVWLFSIRYIAPLSILFLMLNMFGFIQL